MCHETFMIQVKPCRSCNGIDYPCTSCRVDGKEFESLQRCRSLIEKFECLLRFCGMEYRFEGHAGRDPFNFKHNKTYAVNLCKVNDFCSAKCPNRNMPEGQYPRSYKKPLRPCLERPQYILNEVLMDYVINLFHSIIAGGNEEMMRVDESLFKKNLETYQAVFDLSKVLEEKKKEHDNLLSSFTKEENGIKQRIAWLETREKGEKERVEKLRETIPRDIQTLERQKLLLEQEILKRRDILANGRQGFSKEEFKERFHNNKTLFYNSTEWAEVRSFILERDKRTCKTCGKKSSRQVHHDNDPLFFPEICLSPLNLSVLCDECHDEYHRRTKTPADDRSNY